MTRGVPGSTPGHGTNARYNTAKCRCEACCDAHFRRQKEYNLRKLEGQPYMTDRTGTRRRLQALAALGWTSGELAVRIGVDRTAVAETMRYQGPIHTSTAARVKALYDELSMIPGPSVITRSRALAKGWVPPLAWDDAAIDDPSAKPHAVTRSHHRQDDKVIDEVAIQRVLSGDRAALTKAERLVVVERFAAEGLSDAQIATRVGVTDRTIFRDRDENGIESRWAS